MKLFVYAVRDRAADTFGNPMVLQSPGQAVRLFTDEVNRPSEENMLFKHAEDFDLYHLGSFDSDTGLFDCGRPVMLCIGKDVARITPPVGGTAVPGGSFVKLNNGVDAIE